jgi:hypothetical protein
MLRILKRLVIWGAGILLLLLAALPATAQTATPNRANEFEITGTVTALTSTTITLRELRIQIAGAEINDSISVGALVKVHYSVGAGGVRVAREVEQALFDDGDDDNGRNNNGNNGGDNSNSGSGSGDDHGGSSGSGGDDSGGDDHGDSSGHGDSDDGGSDDNGGNSGSGGGDD